MSEVEQWMNKILETMLLYIKVKNYEFFILQNNIFFLIPTLNEQDVQLSHAWLFLDAEAWNTLAGKLWVCSLEPVVLSKV